MDRKTFLKKALTAGTGMCACGVALGHGVLSPSRSQTEDQDWIHDLEKRMIQGSETPDWRKAEKARWWIKDLMDTMDTHLDEATKIRLLQACGKSCFTRAFGVADENKPGPEQIEASLRLLEQRGSEIERREGIVTFRMNWGRDHQNPQGLILQDGYCMCPLVEDGPPRLSPTFCYCSTGYVKESFERLLGPVDVELIDSLKMGGKDCIFKITLRNR